MTRLIHYSEKHLHELYSIPVEKQATHRNGFHKPMGLWVSVEGENDWKEWCEGENWGCLTCATEIMLVPNANVLWVRGVADLEAFHNEYAIVAFRYGGDLGNRMAIDWTPVARKYQGIIIAPYVWELRLDGRVSDWYYGWDCASGCIWNMDAVAGFRPIEEAQAA